MVLQKTLKYLERDRRDMVFNPFTVQLRRFSRHPEAHQQVDHNTMSAAHLLCQLFTFFSQKHPAIRA
ncbi:hypothetical protein D3C79_979820 [compost metagenome]